MSERIIIDGSPASHIVIAALTAMTRNGSLDISKFTASSNNQHSATLLVNGVEVPFMATVDDIYGRMRREIDTEIETRATELLNDMMALESVQDAIESARKTVDDAVNIAFVQSKVVKAATADQSDQSVGHTGLYYRDCAVIELHDFAHADIISNDLLSDHFDDGEFKHLCWVMDNKFNIDLRYGITLSHTVEQLLDYVEMWFDKSKDSV